MGGISITHYLIVALIILVFFGPSKLPALGQALGRSIGSFKKGLQGMNSDYLPPPKDSIEGSNDGLKAGGSGDRVDG